MAFYGSEIIYDGISSFEFGLMLVGKLQSDEQDGTILGGAKNISEDLVLRREFPIFYGIEPSSPLEFKLILSAREDNTSFTRQELAAISGWLYGTTKYKTLSILQDDMCDYYFKCIATEIELKMFSGRVIGIIVSFRCDSSYGYYDVVDTNVTSDGSLETTYHNYSNVNQYYRPIITINATGVSDKFSITNQSDDNSMFKVEDIPQSGAKITIDCLRQIIESDTINDVYSVCNLNFPAFVRGSNLLTITGHGTLTIQNQFPMIIGS